MDIVVFFATFPSNHGTVRKSQNVKKSGTQKRTTMNDRLIASVSIFSLASNETTTATRRPIPLTRQHTQSLHCAHWFFMRGSIFSPDSSITLAFDWPESNPPLKQQGKRRWFYFPIEKKKQQLANPFPVGFSAVAFGLGWFPRFPLASDVFHSNCAIRFSAHTHTQSPISVQFSVALIGKCVMVTLG